ncbi:MAG: hypothetical protein LBN37_02555, partial [Bacteroidales bacterium]|nr:hypothetical protein [Bacteroidales bacterium]
MNVFNLFRRILIPHICLYRWIVLCLLCCAGLDVVAADSYDIQMSVTTAPANCGTDGSITVTLSGADASKLTGILFSIPDHSPISSLTYYNLPPGSYTVTVSGFIGSDAVERTANATITGSSGTSAIESHIIGTRPTLPSLSTGKITVEITGGNAPYTIEVYRSANNALVKTVTLPQSANNQYSVDGLDAGDYYVIVSNACSLFTLPNIHVGTLNNHFNCNGIAIDSLVAATGSGNAKTYINLFGGTNNEYTQDHIAGTAVYWEYQMSFNGGAFSAWKDIPKTGLLIDESSIVKHCDLWTNGYVFRVRLKGTTGISCTSPSQTLPKPTIKRYQYLTFDATTGCAKDTFLFLSADKGKNYTLPVTVKVDNITKGTTIANQTYNKRDWEWTYRISQKQENENWHITITDALGCQIYYDDWTVAIDPQGYWSNTWD